ncbi:MAG: Clp protease ClpC, partial [Candidatus Bipolaricaulota bacterium]|nr:Clp protease ClpC [Candidatus Bipolaricaulota bacterium]
MATRLCDICGIRPATVQVSIVRDGRSEVLHLCSIDYARLRRERELFSPLESLFGRSLWEDFFGEPRTPWHRDREAVDIDAYLSQHAKELLQQAAQTAVDFNKDEVDTEHLLYALMESEVVQEILRQVKISPQDIKGYIEHNAPKGTFKAEKGQTVRLSVSPRVKSALELAFVASRELGHSYVGPEHLLIGLAEEQDGLAGDLLRKYGLTPQALRQQTVKVVGKGSEEGRVQRVSTTP